MKPPLFPAFTYRALSYAVITALSLACFTSPLRAQTVLDADGKPITIGGKAVALTVEGNGVVRVKPEYFMLTVEVKHTGIDKSEVMAACEKKVTELTEAAKKVAVELKPPAPQLMVAYGTGNYAAYSENIPLKPGAKFRAVTKVEASPANAEQAIALLRALAATGATEGIEIYYGVSEAAYRNAALKKALEDASTRAQVMGEAAKPQVLKLIGMQEGQFGAYPVKIYLNPPDVARFVDFSTVPVEANVTLRYALADPPPLPAAAKKPAPAKAAPVKAATPKPKAAKN